MARTERDHQVKPLHVAVIFVGAMATTWLAHALRIEGVLVLFGSVALWMQGYAWLTAPRAKAGSPPSSSRTPDPTEPPRG